MAEVSIDDIKRSVQIIALDNLCNLCKTSLEDDDLTEEEYEYFSVLLYYSEQVLLDLSSKQVNIIQRPSWKKQ